MPEIYDRELIELLAAYEQEQRTIRGELVSLIYYNGQQMLSDWAEFIAKFGEGGQFASLAAQYAADMELGITAQEISTLQGAMQTIIGTMQAIEARAPGMFGISVPS